MLFISYLLVIIYLLVTYLNAILIVITNMVTKLRNFSRLLKATLDGLFTLIDKLLDKYYRTRSLANSVSKW